AESGQPIRCASDVRTRTDSFVRANPGGRLDFVIRRGEQDVPISLIPRENPPAGQGAIGIALAPRPLPANPISAVVFGVRQAWDVMATTFVAPVLALRGDLPAEVVRPVGLPGIAQVVGSAATASVES